MKWTWTEHLPFTKSWQLFYLGSWRELPESTPRRRKLPWKKDDPEINNHKQISVSSLGQQITLQKRQLTALRASPDGKVTPRGWNNGGKYGRIGCHLMSVRPIITPAVTGSPGPTMSSSLILNILGAAPGCSPSALAPGSGSVEINWISWGVIWNKLATWMVTYPPGSLWFLVHDAWV